MLLYFFLVIASFWILKPLKKSIFIRFYDEYGFQWLGMHLAAAQTELLAKILNMVVAAGAVAVFSLLARRFRRHQLCLVFTAFFLVAYVGFAAALARPHAAVVWSFYLFGDLFSTLMVATFFAFLNDSVSPDAARRLYGLIGLGGVLGGVVGSSVLSAWIGSIDVGSWLWICFGLGLAIAAVALVAGRAAERLPPDAVPGPERSSARSLEAEGGVRAALAGARLVGRSRYLLSIVVIVGVYEIVSTIMDFQFTSAVSHFLDGDAIGQHFSRVFAVTNVVSLLVQFLLTSWVLTRFGVGAGLLVLPGAILFGSSVFLARPSLGPGSLLSIADNGFNYSIQQSAKEALYVPTSTAEKYHAKAFIDMFVQRFAKTLAVLLSLGITAWFSDYSAVRGLSLVTLGLMAMWVPAARFAGRRFRELAPGGAGGR
jgi:AAA family ATP:ADP antiporter